MSALHDLTLCEARDALRTRKVSARELTQACLTRIEAHADLNAFITHTPERALADADAADAALAADEARPLTGIPIGIKDLFCTKGVRTTAASRMLENFVPPYESTVTQKLFEAGAVMPGKLNLDEFAMGSANETSYFGPVRSPLRDPARSNVPLTPGGSSGGSSAAVAAKLCYGATGTDTGGSIRQPAAFTGIVGMKPTYGRCSRYGIVAFASSLDQAGPMARTVRDTAALLSVMAGHDPKDSTSVDVAVPDFEAALTGDIRGLRVGLPVEYESDALNPFVRAARDRALAVLRDAGAEPVEVSLPHTSYALPAYYVIAPAEASSNLARYDGVRYGLRVEAPGDDIHALYARTRAAGFGREVRRRILVGTYVLSAGYYDAYYAQALKVRTLIERDFTRAFEKVDVLLTPSAPSAAFALGEKHTDPTQMYLNDVFTVPVNLAGLPAISVPAGVDGAGLPLGVQLIGRPFDESTLFTAAGVIEAAHA